MQIHLRGHGLAAAALAADLARDHQVWWQPQRIPTIFPALLLADTWATTASALARFHAWADQQHLPAPAILRVDAPDAPPSAVAGLLDGAMLYHALAAQAQRHGAHGGRIPAASWVVWVRGPQHQPLQRSRAPDPGDTLRVLRGPTRSHDHYLFRFQTATWRLARHRPDASRWQGISPVEDDQCRTLVIHQQLVARCPGSASLLMLPSLLLQVRMRLGAVPLMS